jgi:hypothetical protein
MTKRNPTSTSAIPEMPSRRKVLAFAAGAAAVSLSAPKLIAGEADPIFAAIERHRKANLDFYAALVEVPGTLSPDPDLEDKYGTIESGARYALSETVPATLAGLAALFQYLRDVADGTATGSRDETFADIDFSRNIFESVHQCLARIAPAGELRI